MLTDLQKKLIDLDKMKDGIKKFYEEYKETMALVVKESTGVGVAFQDEEGIVYQINEAEGKYVPFDKLELVRTKREGEERGSLSVKKAKELGFKIEEKK